jgi:hypothetical protein
MTDMDNMYANMKAWGLKIESEPTLNIPKEYDSEGNIIYSTEKSTKA